jgi:hypothetical protein
MRIISYDSHGHCTPPRASPPRKPTVYTQVIESLPVLELPHPNPPRYIGEGTRFSCFPPIHPTVYTQVIELPHPNPPRMYWGGN